MENSTTLHSFLCWLCFLLLIKALHREDAETLRGMGNARCGTDLFANGALAEQLPDGERPARHHVVPL